MAAQRTVIEDTPVIHRHIVVGLALMLAGWALFIAQRAALDIDWWSSWWALIFLVMGLVRLVSPGVCDGRPLSRRTGLWLTAIGAWALISQARLFGLDYSNSWPLLVIVAGVSVIWRSLESRPGRLRPLEEN